MSEDELTGFAVSKTGELINVFSTVKGWGDMIMEKAIEVGATRLDCFNGFLPRLYARWGFVEVRRELNWVLGGPDVIYMERPVSQATALAA